MVVLENFAFGKRVNPFYTIPILSVLKKNPLGNIVGKGKVLVTSIFLFFPTMFSLLPKTFFFLDNLSFGKGLK